jgi:hypothetical protein
MSILRKKLFWYFLLTNEFEPILIGNFTSSTNINEKQSFHFEVFIQKLHNLVSLGLRNPPAVQRGPTPLSPCGK